VAVPVAVVAMTTTVVVMAVSVFVLHRNFSFLC
jgi:hypothetical protein